MTPKDFALPNAGMNRSLSISKTGNSCVYENMNIRILAHENDTMLSVTNERGTKEMNIDALVFGNLIGWNVLNNHIILFTHNALGQSGLDGIWRIDYVDGEFETEDMWSEESGLLYSGHLGFSADYPIESVVYYESEEIQKIYWVDGVHVLRFMNFMADATERAKWDDTYFDSNRIIHTEANATITKDNSGNTRPNGTIQYLLTYYNLHGQESAAAWISDIVYLSPMEVGGSADGYNNNRITLKFTSLDTKYTNYRVYAIFRSSLDGTVTARIVEDNELKATTATVIDDYANQEEFDAASLLFLGSQEVVPGTLTHKDGTLFLGDLTREGMEELYAALETITSSYINSSNHWESDKIAFCYSNGTNTTNIPYVEDENYYPYTNQLRYSSSQITTFKGGEKYRFALVFHLENGFATKAFWIGDKENSLYPVIDSNNNVIRRVVAKCELPADLATGLTDADSLKTVLHKYGVKYVQLMVAEATYADRSVKAQGIINPTVFNTYNRYNNQLYAAPSWISRPRGSSFAYNHFEPIHISTSSTGEIECNYWTSEATTPTPYYTLSENSIHATVLDKYDGIPEAVGFMIIHCVKYFKNYGSWYLTDKPIILEGHLDDLRDLTELTQFIFSTDDVNNITSGGDVDEYGWCSKIIPGAASYGDIWFVDRYFGAEFTVPRTSDDTDRRTLYSQVSDNLRNVCGIPDNYIIDENTFTEVICATALEHKGTRVFFNSRCSVVAEYNTSDLRIALKKVINYGDDGQSIDYTKLASRWYGAVIGIKDVDIKEYNAAYYRRHCMFIDENVITLNSPEIQYEAVNLDNVDNHKLRIVGVAKITGNISDYTLDASHGKMPGENLLRRTFSSVSSDKFHDGLTSWPLWQEYGLSPKNRNTDDDTNISKSSQDYLWSSNPIVYWQHMWNHSGKITTFSDEDNSDYSTLYNKVFANLRFSYTTIYNLPGNQSQGSGSANRQPSFSLVNGSLRQFNYTNSQLLSIKALNTNKYYNGIIRDSLSLPGEHKYPVLYSLDFPKGDKTSSKNAYLYSASPVQLTYSSSPHIVASLGYSASGMEILPKMSFEQGYVPGPNRCLPWDFGKSGAIFVDLFYSSTANSNYTTNPDGTSRYDVPIDTTSPHYSNFLRVLRHFGNLPVYSLFNGIGGIKFFAQINTYSIEVSNNTTKLVFNGDVLAKTTSSTGSVNVNVFYYPYDDLDDNAKQFGVLNIVNHTFTRETDDAKTFTVHQGTFNLYNLPDGYPSSVTSVTSLADSVSINTPYLLVGELYYDYNATGVTDTRYGGITSEAVKNNRFIPAGKKYGINTSSTFNIYGTEGDTYFQRWDCLKTTPIEGSKDGVIDITSFMVETHINLDGRTDRQRGVTQLASINLDTFGLINPVYTQADNYFTKRNYDKESDEKSYRTAITWTLEKANGADIDEWSHITLASSLVLDGDKGPCNALRRISNTLVAFQDTAISEILFNSRTQLSTENGIPVEIANSGKVDGKRVLTDKYGCHNKWSIVNGKNAIYFVDSFNKAFCAFNGGNIENLSAKLGFDVWFKVRNDLETWKPVAPFNTFVSYYDKVNSDVYILKTGTDNEAPCLVYNEILGTFTSFYDYKDVPMMVNVYDRFVSFHVDNGNGKLWLQNEGLFCNFYGTQYDYWMQYRVTPDPYSDKIWTNLEYRADFYEVLDSNGDLQKKQSTEIDGGVYWNGSTEQWISGKYLHNETFDDVKIWNEYQQTGNFGGSGIAAAIKKFRIWRFIIPRALRTDTNKYGLDRIRNPWINLKLKKTLVGNAAKAKNLMQMHDMIVRYYE